MAFIIADQLSLYEQQSTFNPNMPLRMLEYTANLFEKYIKREALNKYGHRQIMLPVPRLVVFYNGTEEKANETTLHLADAFAPERRDSADISVTVRMININKGHTCPERVRLERGQRATVQKDGHPGGRHRQDA